MKMRLNGLWFAFVGFLMPWTSLLAEDGESLMSSSQGLTALAAGLGIAVAVFASAAAQGRIASSYLEGVARNPGAQKVMFTPLILGLAFVETLVLFTILIQMMVLGKI